MSTVDQSLRVWLCPACRMCKSIQGEAAIQITPWCSQGATHWPNAYCPSRFSLPGGPLTYESFTSKQCSSRADSSTFQHENAFIARTTQWKSRVVASNPMNISYPNKSHHIKSHSYHIPLTSHSNCQIIHINVQKEPMKSLNPINIPQLWSH